MERQRRTREEKNGLFVMKTKRLTSNFTIKKWNLTWLQLWEYVASLNELQFVIWDQVKPN